MNKQRAGSFPSSKKPQANYSWKEIQNFILKICENEADQLIVFHEEEKNLSQFASEKSPTRVKHFYTIKQYLKDEFAQITEAQGYNLKEQIQQSFKSSFPKLDEYYSSQLQFDNNEVEKDNQTKMSYMYNQMTLLGTNSNSLHFSDDGRFVLKGIPSSQFNQFKQSLSQICFKNIYCNSNSLSVKILGLFEIQDEQTWSTGGLTLPSNYFILMENILSDWNFNLNTIQSIYDLKGSSFGRDVANSDTSDSSDTDTDKKDSSENRSRQSTSHSPSQFKVDFGKDNNFKTNEKDKEILHSLPEDFKNELLLQIQEECKQFMKGNTMDYSLIVVIGKLNEEVQLQAKIIEKQITTQINKFKNYQYNNYVFTFGLIDYLTEYDIKKSIESTFKALFYSNKDSISCIDPEAYFERITKYVKKEVLNIQASEK